MNLNDAAWGLVQRALVMHGRALQQQQQAWAEKCTVFAAFGLDPSQDYTRGADGEVTVKEAPRAD